MTEGIETRPSVYVVDDDERTLQVVSGVLGNLDYDVKTFSSAEQFLDAYYPHKPGCLVLDYMMPGLSGLELQEVLNERGWSIPIVLVSANASVPLTVQAMEKGAVAVIEKPIYFAELISRVEQAIELDVHTRVDSLLRLDFEKRYMTLSDREKEIVSMIVRGYLSKEIASNLSLSVRTVEAHRSRIMKKMKTKSLADLASEFAKYDKLEESS